MKRLLPFLLTACILCSFCSGTAQTKAGGSAPADDRQPQTGETGDDPSGIRLNYGPGENNWMILYAVPGNKPAPVYLWGHPNSDGKTPPSAADISSSMVGRLNKRGIAVISWESVPQVKTLNDVATCEEDLETLYSWLCKYAAAYNLDMENFFVGGMSRGTVISWKFANAVPGRVRGVFYAQGLPKGAWADGKERPLDYVTRQSPPIVFTYREGMDTTDGHSPRYGQRIVDRYTELGIGDRAALYHSQGKNLYTQAPDFILQHIK